MSALGRDRHLTHVEREFSALIAPLEARVRRPFGQPWRGRCLAAFSEAPEGFRRLVGDVGTRPGTRNPLGLLARMVADEEHLLVVPAKPDPFSCSRCRRAFASTYDRREHEEACDGA